MYLEPRLLENIHLIGPLNLRQMIINTLCPHWHRIAESHAGAGVATDAPTNAFNER